MRNFARSVPSLMKPADRATCPDAGLFTRWPSSSRSKPSWSSAQSASVAAALLVQPRPRARAVIQYQNQPERFSSSTVTQTTPTRDSLSQTAHGRWGGGKKLRTVCRHSAQHPQGLSHRLAGPYPGRTRMRPKQRSHRKCAVGGGSVSTRVSFRGLVPGAVFFVRFAPHQSQDWNLSRFGHL